MDADLAENARRPFRSCKSILKLIREGWDVATSAHFHFCGNQGAQERTAARSQYAELSRL
jgi:hypothetical protein